MSRVNVEGARLDNVRMHQSKNSAIVKTITADLTLTDSDPDVIVVDPGTTARSVLMPVTSAANEGRRFIIYNMGTSTGAVTVKNSAGTALAGAASGVVAIGTGATVVNVGGTWRLVQ